MLSAEPGPSPWYLQPLAGVTADDPPFTWRSAGDGDAATGKSVLVDQGGRDLLLIGFYCWVRRLGASKLLVWHQTKRSALDRGGAFASVHIHVFDLVELRPLTEVKAACQALDQSAASVLWAGGHVACFTATPFETPGLHHIDVPPSLKEADELILLVNAAHPSDSPRIHIWIVRPGAGTLEVLPQDWFNNGAFDFGYEWITRVARDPSSGGLVGEGIRMRPFALDDSGTQLKEWLKVNPFGDR